MTDTRPTLTRGWAVLFTPTAPVHLMLIEPKSFGSGNATAQIILKLREKCPECLTFFKGVASRSMCADSRE